MALADYLPARLLGRGGVAEVRLARVRGGPGASSAVVVKRLLPAAAGDAAAVALLLREARFTARVRHPGVVKVIEAGVEEGTPYVVMEWVDGCDLARLVAVARERGIALPVPFAVAIALRAAEALHAAHLARGPDGRPLGLVHCDVSPSNLFASRDGEVKVGDFGIARVRGEGVLGAHLGKVRYLAPEVARGEPVDARTDVFGLGAVLHELLTLEPAFPGREAAEVTAAILAGERTPPSAWRPEVPPALDAVVLRALAPAPRARFTSAGAMAAALAAQHDEQLAGPLSIAALVRALAPARDG